MDNRRRLVTYLQDHKHIIDDDPLYHTKTFLSTNKISMKKFFIWLIDESSRFNYLMNNDTNVRIFLQ